MHRLNYHASPTLGVNGLTFYEQTINEALEKMGSTYNVGIGISVGGAAALYFGSRCEFDQVIAFSPVCPISEYCSLFNQIRSIFDFPRLFTAPKSYLEQLIVTLATAWSYRRTVKLVGKENFWPVLEEFRDSRRQPKTTILYGTRTGPDARQAKHFNAFPQVKQIGLDTNSHNGAGFLKQQGTLASTLLDEIQAGIAAKQAEQDNQTDKLGLSKPRSA